MQVTIIDDGINQGVFPKIKVTEDIIVDSKGKLCKRENVEFGRFSHGTICAAIIKKYACNVEFCSIKILDSNDYKCKCEKLIAALKYCDIKRKKIIHLSLGTENFDDFKSVHSIILKLLMNEVIIIAAMSNSGRYAVPANIPGVFSVKNESKLNCNQIIYNTDNFKDAIIGASSYQTIKDNKGNNYIPMYCNSFAAPVLTAEIIKNMNEKNLENISNKKIFEMTNISLDDIFVYNSSCFFNEAIIFDFSENILESEIDFEILNKYNLKNLKDLYIKKNCYIVIFPSKNLNIEYQNILIAYKNYIRGILFAGIMSEKLKKFLNLNEIYYWSEDCYERQVKRISRKINKKVPIILIIGVKEKSIPFTKKMSNEMKKFGYNNIMVSNIEYAYCYGFEYFNKNINLTHLIDKLNEKHKISCILLCVKKNNIFFKSDYQINLVKNISKVSINGTQINVPSKFKTQMIKEIIEIMK